MKMELRDCHKKISNYVIGTLVLCALFLVLSVSDVYAGYTKNLEDITFGEWDKVSAVNIGPDYKMNDTRYTGINELVNFHYLSYITVDPRNEELSSYQGVLYNKDKTVLMCFPQGLHKASIPSTCKEITPDALYGTSRSVRNQVKRIITRNNGGKWPGYKEYVNPLNQKREEKDDDE